MRNRCLCAALLVVSVSAAVFMYADSARWASDWSAISPRILRGPADRGEGAVKRGAAEKAATSSSTMAGNPSPVHSATRGAPKTHRVTLTFYGTLDGKLPANPSSGSICPRFDSAPSP
jgi:hypothetical protein